jgi:hypothetical protein
MKITKGLLRGVFTGGLVAILLAILVPRTLTFLELMLCWFSIFGLVELVKSDIRADIRADVRREHEATRVWLRDWFDPDYSHANDEEGEDE